MDPWKKKNTAVDPLRLTKFFDNDFMTKSGSLKRSNGKSQVYRPEDSWDGLSVNPKPFARFDETNTVAHAPTRPSGMAGPRVIELEGHGMDGIFGHNPKGRPVPRTVEQIVVGHRAADGGAVGAAADPSRAEVAVAADSPRFLGTRGVQVPMAQAVAPPAVLAKAGPNWDATLLTPAERRELLQYEKRARAGAALAKKAAGDERRLVQLMRARHPQGVLGVDGAANPDSQVYRDRYEEATQKEARAQSHMARRRAELERVGRADRRVGYDPFAHSEQWEAPAAAGPAHRFLQAKGARPAAMDTHDRVFGQSTAGANPRRTQNIRNQDLGGKAFDIINGSAIVHAPPTNNERVHRHLAHPSQQSLERGRNQQGAHTRL